MGGSGWGGHLEGEAAPLEALVRVVGQGEGGDDQPAGHTAKLPAEPLHVLADALVPTAANREEELSPASWGPPLPTLTDPDTQSLDPHQDSRLLSRFTIQKRKTKQNHQKTHGNLRIELSFCMVKNTLFLNLNPPLSLQMGATPGQGWL